MLQRLPANAVENIDETYTENPLYRVLSTHTPKACSAIKDYSLLPAQIFVEVLLQLDKIKELQDEYLVDQIYTQLDQEYKYQIPNVDSLQRCQIVSTILMPLAVVLLLSKWNLYHDFGKKIINQITTREVQDWHLIEQLCDNVESETHRLSNWINSYMEDGNIMFYSDMVKKIYQTPINTNGHSFRYMKQDTNANIKESFELALHSDCMKNDNKAICNLFKEHKYCLKIDNIKGTKLHQELTDFYDYTGSYDAINDIIKKIRE